MYLRHTTRVKDGKSHTYWRLVRSVRRGAKGLPETVAQLGELDANGRAKAKALARSITGRGDHDRQGDLFEPATAPVAVRLDRVRVERGRAFGAVWLGWELWQALKFDELLEELLPAGREKVPWSTIAAVLVKNVRATGVALESGEEIQAPIVASCLDPRRTFLQLLDEKTLPGDLVEGITRYKFRGSSGKVNLALDGLPEGLGERLADQGDQRRAADGQNAVNLIGRHARARLRDGRQCKIDAARVVSLDHPLEFPPGQFKDDVDRVAVSGIRHPDQARRRRRTRVT